MVTVGVPLGSWDVIAGTGLRGVDLRIVLVSGYELGHQPINLAVPGAALGAAGHDVMCIDTSITPLGGEAIDWADAVAVSVPMHTAMRLAIDTARYVRSRRPELPICFYGLYAAVGADRWSDGLVDQVIAGEYESTLVDWAGSVDCEGSHAAPQSVVIDTARGPSTAPNRSLLQPLENYAMLEVAGERHLAGYVETTRGCRHRCRHCPVPVIYDGRVRVVDPDAVLSDIAGLVEAGARHITFGDPDFFNAVPHSMKVAEAVHHEFPELTFDCTIKVEHLLKHRDSIPALAAAGCLFVVTAIESTSDLVLDKLQKGHVHTEAVESIGLLRGHGIEMRPTFLPFTPWTKVPDLLDLCHFIAAHDLIGNVDPVQMTIRLLIPDGSLLLDDPSLAEMLGPFDHERLTHPWSSPDPTVDQLQADLSILLEKFTAEDTPPVKVFEAMWRLVHEAAGVPDPGPDTSHGSIEGRPRLTEPWFC